MIADHRSVLVEVQTPVEGQTGSQIDEFADDFGAAKGFTMVPLFYNNLHKKTLLKEV